MEENESIPSELEAQLARQVPVAPSDALLARLRLGRDQVLARPAAGVPGSGDSQRPGSFHWVRWFAGGTGAVALVMALLNLPGKDPASDPSKTVTGVQAPRPGAEPLIFPPPQTNRLYLKTEELALVQLDGQPPLQLLRVQWVDYARAEAQDGSEIWLTEFHDRIVPASLNLY